MSSGGRIGRRRQATLSKVIAIVLARGYPHHTVVKGHHEEEDPEEDAG